MTLKAISRSGTAAETQVLRSATPGCGVVAQGRVLLRWISTALSSALLLSGCLLDRLETVKAQTCDPDAYFDLSLGETTTLTFQEPVLLKNDIGRLLLAEPVAAQSAGGLVGERYELAKLVHDDGATRLADMAPYSLEFWYLPEGNNLKLVEARMPGVLGGLLTPELLKQAYAQACTTELAIAWRGIEQKLTEEQLALVPARAGILELLGPPTGADEPGSGLIYQYRWLGSQNEAADAIELKIHFETPGEQPAGLVARYGNVSMTADFQSAVATMRYRGWGG